MEWGDRIPIGIIYREEKPSYMDHLPHLEGTPLYARERETEAIEGFIREFI